MLSCIMDGCGGLFNVLQSLRIWLRRWPREKLGSNGNISGVNHFSGAFEALHCELLIIASQSLTGA